MTKQSHLHRDFSGAGSLATYLAPNQLIFHLLEDHVGCDDHKRYETTNGFRMYTRDEQQPQVTKQQDVHVLVGQGWRTRYSMIDTWSS
jgi:hypothetical protein